MALPTVPGLVSHAVESTSVNTPPSVLPQYSVSTGPHHSIIWCLVVGAIGAAPCSTVPSDDGSKAARSSSGRRRSRTHIVGTTWLLRIWRSWISCRHCDSSQRGITTSSLPLARSMAAKPERRGVVQRAGDEVGPGAVEAEHHARRPRRAPA